MRIGALNCEQLKRIDRSFASIEIVNFASSYTQFVRSQRPEVLFAKMMLDIGNNWHGIVDGMIVINVDRNNKRYNSNTSTSSIICDELIKIYYVGAIQPTIALRHATV